MPYKCYYKDGTIFEGGWLDVPHLKDPFKILHREDGSAIEHSDGDKYWYLNGEIHREDGPAIEWYDGDKEWWWKGKRHREDGPAAFANRVESWYLGDIRYSKEEFNKILNEVDSLDPSVGLIDPREWVRNRWKKRIQ